MNLTTRTSIMAFALLQVCPLVAGAQSDPYVIFSHTGLVRVLQGGTIRESWVGRRYDLAPAVRDTIRAVPNRGPDPGHEYRFDGTLTGSSYVRPPLEGNTFDAGASMSHNYIADNLLGMVYECDPDWSNPRQLFVTGESYVGITYDSSDDTLWLSSHGSSANRIVNMTLDGRLIREFSPGDYWRWGCLAYEPSSDTLWTINNFSSEIKQFDKDGLLLRSITNVSLGDVWGGEFPVAGTGPYSISIDGTCPGFTTVDWNRATPGLQQAIVFGLRVGFSIVPAGPCAGTSLDLAGTVRLVRLLSTGNGAGSVSGQAGSSACGGRLQFLEIGTCNTSNVVQIE